WIQEQLEHRGLSAGVVYALPDRLERHTRIWIGVPGLPASAVRILDQDTYWVLMPEAAAPQVMPAREFRAWLGTAPRPFVVATGGEQPSSYAPRTPIFGAADDDRAGTWRDGSALIFGPDEQDRFLDPPRIEAATAGQAETEVPPWRPALDGLG